MDIDSDIRDIVEIEEEMDELVKNYNAAVKDGLWKRKVSEGKLMLQVKLGLVEDKENNRL
jgi:hypothetical protein